MQTAIKQNLTNHTNFFNTHKTKDISYRIQMLKTLKQAILQNEDKISQALFEDLGKSPFEAYETEIGMVLDELSHHIKHLEKWSRPQKVPTPLSNFPSKSFIVSEPLGTVLIMAPWNYPFQLLLAPLVGVISAGNCAVLKPAHYSEKTSAVIEEMISTNFPSEYISVFQGGREVNQALLQEKYDYIFFTGGATLGKIVMRSAAENLTPLTLELGGKSPCIVDSSANISLSARRIVWGKFLNSGQTCVAPDYLLVHKDVKESLINEMCIVLKEFFGEDPQKSPDFPRIITKKQHQRLMSLMNSGEVICGGRGDEKESYIAPTLLDNVSPDSPIMQEEIFGPLLPIISWSEPSEMMEFIRSRPKPLALYLFTTDKSLEKELLSKVSFGGGCINDTIVHLANPNLPFGGVGFSGMGKYHAKSSFDLFSNKKSILKKSLKIDIPIRYAPYKGKLGTIKKFLK